MSKNIWTAGLLDGSYLSFLPGLSYLFFLNPPFFHGGKTGASDFSFVF